MIFYILLTLAIWYVTKLYYTGKFNFDYDHRDEVKVICYSCSRYYWVDKTNLRNPYYCNVCK